MLCLNRNEAVPEDINLAGIKRKLIEFLKTGMTPERLALCIALGLAIGIIPALGTTTLLCALTAFIFRLNLAAIQLVNWIVYPVQVLLLIPFIQAGARMFGKNPIPFSFKQIQEMLEVDRWGTVFSLWTTILHAVAVWAVIAPFIVVLVYIGLNPLLRKYQNGLHLKND
jgi:uncharacterized protein (DUF2062 family)